MCCIFPVLKSLAWGRQSRCPSWTYKLRGGRKFSIKLSPLSVDLPQRRPLNLIRWPQFMNSQKNPRTHMNKIGTPTPPKTQNTPPPKMRHFMGMGFSCRKNAFFQAPIKNWRSHFRPQTCGQKSIRTRGFFWSSPGCNLWTTLRAAYKQPPFLLFTSSFCTVNLRVLEDRNLLK